MGVIAPSLLLNSELITCSKGIEVLREPASSGNLAEINLKQPKKDLQKNLCN